MNQKYLGTEFLNMQGKKMNVELFLEKFNRYYVTYLHNGTKLNELMSDQDIEFYISKQEEIKKDIEYMENIETKRQQEAQQEKLNYENVNGFCDNMDQLQKAKTLTILNKNVSYSGKYTTRKEHIEDMLQKGYTPTIKDKIMTSSRKINLERIVKYKYDVPVMENENGFYEVTKTEYNYAMYLQNKLVYA